MRQLDSSEDKRVKNSSSLQSVKLAGDILKSRKNYEIQLMMDLVDAAGKG